VSVSCHEPDNGNLRQIFASMVAPSVSSFNRLYSDTIWWQRFRLRHRSFSCHFDPANECVAVVLPGAVRRAICAPAGAAGLKSLCMPHQVCLTAEVTHRITSEKQAGGTLMNWKLSHVNGSQWTTPKGVRVVKVCVAALLVAGAASSTLGADYRPVTDARLARPEPANWLMTRGNYQGWSYSALDQINVNNVKSLVPVWSFSTGVDSGHEAPPIVNDGVMFVSTPYSQVVALDAATGDLLWRYKRRIPEGFSALHNTSRGVALYGDKVLFPAL